MRTALHDTMNAAQLNEYFGTIALISVIAVKDKGARARAVNRWVSHARNTHKSSVSNSYQSR